MEERLNRRHRRRRLLNTGLLLLGILMLGVFVWQLRTSAPQPIAPTSTPTAEPTSTREAALPASADRITPPVSVGTAGSSTPADDWAQVIVEIALPELVKPRPPLEGLVWWQSDASRGFLTVSANTVQIDDITLNAADETHLLVQVPDPVDPTRLTTIGEAVLDGNTLQLSTEPLTPPFEIRRWVIGNATPQLAVRAIARYAQAEEFPLIAAYAPNADQPAELALLHIEPPDVPTATPASATPTLTATPTPTPTREPDAYLARLMAEVVDNFVAVEPAITTNAVYEYAFGHPRVGVLTWQGDTARVGDEPIAVNDANELIVYRLLADDTDGGTIRMFNATFDGTITRLPDEQVYFQGQRMGEMVSNLVNRAREQGGQLLVVYDDFGEKQTLTFIGFQPLDEPTSTPVPSATSAPGD